MSRIRRLRHQSRLRGRIAGALHAHAAWQRRHYLYKMAVWFLMTWRGYAIRDAVTTEIDLVMVGIVRWTRAQAPLWTLPLFIKQAVAWAH